MWKLKWPQTYHQSNRNQTFETGDTAALCTESSPSWSCVPWWKQGLAPATLEGHYSTFTHELHLLHLLRRNHHHSQGWCSISFFRYSFIKKKYLRCFVVWECFFIYCSFQTRQRVCFGLRSHWNKISYYLCGSFPSAVTCSVQPDVPHQGLGLLWYWPESQHGTTSPEHRINNLHRLLCCGCNMSDWPNMCTESVPSHRIGIFSELLWEKCMLIFVDCC